MLRDVDEQLLLQKLLQYVLGGHVNEGLKETDPQAQPQLPPRALPTHPYVAGDNWTWFVSSPEARARRKLNGFDLVLNKKPDIRAGNSHPVYRLLPATPSPWHFSRPQLGVRERISVQ